MNCDQVRDPSVIEAYLAGRLAEADRDAFEMHYLECDGCYAAVEAMRAIQAGVRAVPKEPVPIRRAGAWSPRWVLVAAAVLIAGVVLVERRQHPAESPVALAPQAAQNLYAELARFDPPPFSPVRLRTALEPGDAEFHSAMEAYPKHDWAACESSLHAVASKYPQAMAARYYFGICALLAKDTATGAEALRQTIIAGDSPYLEEAHFYLAKALLAEGDAVGARAELNKTVAMAGDLAPQAATLLARIP